MRGKLQTISAAGAAGLLSISLILLAGCSQDPNAAGPSSGGGPVTSAGTTSGGTDKPQTEDPGKSQNAGAVAATVSASELMEKNCKCHGPGGKGGNAPVIAGTTDSDEELIKTITEGHDKMPAFKDKLTSDQIKMVVAELKSAK